MQSELPKPELFVGIDQSYSGFGLVTLDTQGTYNSYLWNFTKNKGGDSERLKIIMDMLSNMFWNLDSYECHIVMEGYAHGSRFNREKLGELGGIVKLAVYETFKKEPLIIAPTVLKKFVTGKGTASKEDMIKGVNSRWSAGITDNNIADAYGLAQYLKEIKSVQ